MNGTKPSLLLAIVCSIASAPLYSSRAAASTRSAGVCARVGLRLALLVGLFGVAGRGAASNLPPVQIDTDFPGGNIVVERVEGDTVHIRPDVRETRGRWFYWYFRVRGAGTRTLNFRFTIGNPISVRGPAVSSDGGRTWKWLGGNHLKDAAFSYTFTSAVPEVRFSVAMPYTQDNLREFIARVGSRPDFVVGTLAKSEHGRDVELLRVGKLDGKPKHRVALTARHHACEMMASYLLEGIIEEILAETDTGRWLRGNVAFLIAPMMDKDGVEEGLQGKNRIPHDHCRDYIDATYATVAAMKKLLPAWSEGRLRIALDLHCPSLRGGKNGEAIHFVGGLVPEVWHRTQRLSTILEACQKGPLVHRSIDNVPHGTLWNKLEVPSSFGLWAANLPGINISTTLEFPYADIRGEEVNAATARAYGRNVAEAIRLYLTTEVER